jgi:hypothetical protein
MKQVYRIGLLGAGGKLTISNSILKFQHPYGRRFTVPVDQIETVTTDVVGWGNSKLKIIGNGTELASIKKIPSPWAEKAQEWILDQLKKS